MKKHIKYSKLGTSLFIGKTKLFVLFFSLISGCTSLSINPESTVCEGSNELKIHSFSYSHERRKRQVNAFEANIVNDNKNTTNEEPYYEGYEELLIETMALLPNATFLKEIPTNNKSPHLHISSQYTRQTDSCSFMILSMFTAFLVPMWCTEPNFYTLKFETYIEGKIIKKNIYSVDRNGYVHLVLLPVGIIQDTLSSGYKPLSQYKTALNSSLRHNCE
jgi:hypothetical protein